MKIKILKETTYSGAIIYDCNEKTILMSYFNRDKPKFSTYLPSILFLYQTDLYLNLNRRIKEKLDCYIVNSSGQLHPYLFGAACDFGLRINTPVIGYTKKLLYGNIKINGEPQNFHGISSNDHLIGYAIPRPNSKKYFYISIGNNLSLQKALNIFLKLDLTLISKLNTMLNDYIKKDIAN
ncbi:MAG: endonuclease V [Promethearchaeota archaeon]